jgi:hypothetical protein
MRGRIQGTSEWEDSKNIQGTFREHSGNNQWNKQGGIREDSRGIREESGRNQGTEEGGFKEHSGRIQERED